MITENGLHYRIRHERMVDVDGAVLDKGGRTIAQIVADVNHKPEDGDETVLAVGVALCRPDELFSKRLGRTIAMGRARVELLGRPGKPTV